MRLRMKYKFAFERCLSLGMRIRISICVAFVGSLFIGCSQKQRVTTNEAANALTEQGFTDLRAGRHSDAVGNFTKALQIKPDTAAAYCGRAQSEYELHELSASLAD